MCLCSFVDARGVCSWLLWCLWLPFPGQYFYFQEVLPVLAAKHCMMQATAELHQSALAKQKKRFGEEIARLQVSAVGGGYKRSSIGCSMGDLIKLEHRF